jgi:multiple sugar transport system substrate-binding protein
VIGNWNYAVPKGANNKKAALAFARWFLSHPAQYAYGKAGGIPVRTDVLASDLAKDPMNRWMPAYLEAMKTAKQELGYQEGAQVEAVLGLKLNQALIGELSSAKALNQAAQEIKAIFEKSGRKTGLGPALAE